VIGGFTLSGLLFTMHLYVSCFCIVEYFPGNVILRLCNVPCLVVLVFVLAVCIWRLLFELRAVILSRTL